MENNGKLTTAGAPGALVEDSFKGSSTQSTKTIAVPKKWIRVGTVKELLMYPIKSCKRVHVQKATCTQIGLQGMEFLKKINIFYFIFYNYSEKL